jgi:cell fate regulator YaaT (PSP1 superfamily)
MDPFIVGLRFQKIGKVYHFDARRFRGLHPGDFVIVETSRGRQIGEIMQVFEESPPPPPDGSWKPIERLATPRDLVLRQVWGRKELEATINCRAKAAEMGVRGVKIVGSEFSFDGSRLTFLYSSESGDRQELGKLRSAMQRTYTRTRVEMRQIGPRDVAKIIGGMGACGLETRCCSKFLTEFSPVSIKMAKDQGISLTPSEITGMCGRLRCCLVYEYEQYVEARKTLPKRGKKVVSSLGEGKVVDTFPLRQSVLVQLGDGKRHEFMKYELEPWDELEALRRKSEAPCDRHENGGCDCGKAGNAEVQAPPKPAADARLEQDLEDEINQRIGYQDGQGGQQPRSAEGAHRKSRNKRRGKPRDRSARGAPGHTRPDGQGGSRPDKKKNQPRRPAKRNDAGNGQPD